MKTMEIIFNDRVFKIKKETIVYVLYRLSGKDFSDKDDSELLKVMKRYHLFDEITLESMIN